MEEVKIKYNSYILNYKINESGIKKPIFAYIIKLCGNEVGFIQFYDFYDFNNNSAIKEIISEKYNDLINTAGLDLFIGEEFYIGKGYGSKLMLDFLENFVKPEFDSCIVDPDIKNQRAVKSYSKAGFLELGIVGNTVFLIKILK